MGNRAAGGGGPYEWLSMAGALQPGLAVIVAWVRAAGSSVPAVLDEAGWRLSGLGGCRCVECGRFLKRPGEKATLADLLGGEGG